jgi:hypothetical protein
MIGFANGSPTIVRFVARSCWTMLRTSSGRANRLQRDHVRAHEVRDERADHSPVPCISGAHGIDKTACWPERTELRDDGAHVGRVRTAAPGR